MKEVEDQRWRAAAESLGLELVTSRGRKIDNAKGKRSHAMRGVLDGHRVTSRYGLQDEHDGIMVIEVRLNRPLLLGLTYRVTGAPRDYRGRRIGAKHTDVLGIERARVQAMVETEPGVHLAHLMNRLGDTGWAELDDTMLRVHLEFYTDLSEGYQAPITTATRIAALAEQAREELAPAAWEPALASNLAAAADALRLDWFPRSIAVTGSLRAMAASLRLDTRNGYALRGRIALPEALPDGSRIERRSHFWSKLAAIARFDRPSSDAAFNAIFEAAGALRSQLPATFTGALVDLARDGDVRVDTKSIVFRTPDLTLDAALLLERLGRAAEHLARRGRGSPYR